jgi:hypothetical protein
MHIVNLASSTEKAQITGFKGATIINGTIDNIPRDPMVYFTSRIAMSYTLVTVMAASRLLT